MMKTMRMRWAGHVGNIGQKNNAYRTLTGQPEGKRPLGKPRRTCVVNIKMYLREMEWNGMGLIHLT
jgi:hypothetical protein